MSPEQAKTTPRAEAFTKAAHHETVIRMPALENLNDNKIDHYAVMSQVINAGVDRYLSDSEYHIKLQQTHSIAHLDANLIFDLHQVIRATLKDSAFDQHRNSLAESTLARQEIGVQSWASVDAEINAGVKAYVSTTSHIFGILKSRFNADAAAHENNWQLLDKITKMNVDRFNPYHTTYLVVHENYSLFREQIEEAKGGGFDFKLGFPTNAQVTMASTVDYKGFKRSQDLVLNGTNPTISLKNIVPRKVTVGCPISFDKDTVKELWDTYRVHAYRIAINSGISAGGIEASHQ